MTSKLPVANFHGLGRPPIPIDADEKPYWLSADQYAEALGLLRASKRPFLVTFDDGNISDIELGLPGLQPGEHAIVFVCADRIGQEGYLGKAELRAIAKMPDVSLGSHGNKHTSWRKASGEERDLEIRGSRVAIEKASGQAVIAAGIPFGDYDGEVLKAILSAGYQRAYSSDGGPRLVDDPLVPRMSLRGDLDIGSQIRRLLDSCAVPSRVKQEAKLRAKALLK